MKFIDIGTNAEIILGNRRKLLVTSSPTGPAFEGAQIRNGQRAAPGAFGSYIDVRYAMVLGQFPDCDLEHVSAAGNAAGTGARIALLNRSSRWEIEERVRAIQKIETATDKDFQDHYISAMGI